MPRCSDTADVATARNAATPWCTPLPAAGLAAPGDTVHLASTTYHAQLRPLSSGTPAQPIVYLADGPVTIVAPPGTISVMLTGVHDIVLRGFTVRASAPQAIWVDDASRILIDRTTVANDRGVGVQIKAGNAVTVARSRLINNARAGLFDMTPARGTTLSGSLVRSNGRDGQRYNGDGVELNSTGATVNGNRITRNGDGVGFEHGIYAGSSARSYTISGNTIGDNAGADIKAVRRAGGSWRATGSSRGSSASSSPTTRRPSPCSTTSSRAASSTASCSPRTGRRRARGSGTTPCSRPAARRAAATPRRCSSLSAAQLELRNNLIAYTNADALGAALMINDRSRLGSFLSSTNWYASTDRARRRLAWNGSRVTFGQWRNLTGQDASSIDSPPPRFAASGRVASAQHGRRPRHAPRPRARLHRAGRSIPARPPDIGAFQHA